MIFSLLLFLQSYSIVTSMDPDVVDMLTPMHDLAEACGYASCPEVNEDMLTVHIVPHSHGELGYTATFSSHYTGNDDLFPKTVINMKRILDFTVTELWSKPHRRFTFSDMPYLFHWWANRDETVRRMVYELLRQGRLFFVGGGWSMSDEATTSYHAIIDHFTYSLRKINATFLTCGRPLVAWQAEVLGHSREFTSLMAQMGFDGLFINPISYDDELARMRRRGMEFIWRGSDDLGGESDIFTHKLFDGYWSPPGFCFGALCKDPLLTDTNDSFTNILDRLEKFVESMKYRQAPYYATRNVLVMMGEREGYYDANSWFRNIDKLITVLNSRHTDIQAVYSTPACYLKAVYEANPQLQTKQDDFFPYAYDKDSYATGMYSSRPSLKYFAKEVLRFLQISKQIQVTARLRENNKIFEEYNWINGVLQDHNIITGQSRPHVISYYVAKATRATEKVVDHILQRGFNKLRNDLYEIDMIKCRFNVSRCRCTDGPHMFIVIYNPLAWPVTMPVRLPIFDRDQIVYDPKGNKVPAALMKIPEPVAKLPERNSSYTHELVFFAEDLPPMGLRSYYFQRYQLGWERPVRSLIKKIKSKSKKYIVTQTDKHSNERNQQNDDIEPEYELFDEYTTKEAVVDPKTKIVFVNISNYNKKHENSDVVTPRSHKLTENYENIKVTTEKAIDATENDKKIDNIDRIINIDATQNDKNIDNIDRIINIDATENNKNIDNIDRIINANQVTLNSNDLDSVKTTERNFGSNNREVTEKLISVNTVKKTQKFQSDEYWHGYRCHETNHPYIRNKYVRVNLNKERQIANISLVNGVRVSMDISLVYYVSDDPERLGKARRPPGAYLFRTMDSKQEVILDNNIFETKVFKNDLVQEIHCKLSSWASFALKLYKNSPVLELDWLVGPIPNEDGLGKEVMIKYTTNLNNKGVFYTDSNGRQTMKRIRNMRPLYEPVNQDPIAGNLYPVTSKIYIVDEEKNIRFSVLNDRAQAGSSLKDGELSLLLHRRLFTEDDGIQAYLNETWDGIGTIVRGQHYLYISKADHKPYRIFEKKLAKEIELKPQILVSPAQGYGNDTRNIWLECKNEFSGLKTKLPIGLHLLSFEEWNDNTLLVRFENYLEKSDVVHSGVKSIVLKDIFNFITLKDVQETTLGGNVLLKEWVPLSWNKDRFLRSYNEAYGTNQYNFATNERRELREVTVDTPIEFAPQQIRTFVLWYSYN